MSEYIARDAAIAIIEEKQKELCPVGRYSRHYVYGSDRERFDAWQEIIDALEAIQMADVEEVVLCQDCKFEGKYLGGKLYCKHDKGLLAPKPDDYCSYGERREE